MRAEIEKLRIHNSSLGSDLRLCMQKQEDDGNDFNIRLEELRNFVAGMPLFEEVIQH